MNIEELKEEKIDLTSEERNELTKVLEDTIDNLEWSIVNMKDKDRADLYDHKLKVIKDIIKRV